MKKRYLLILSVFIVSITNAQDFIAGQTIPNGTYHDVNPDTTIFDNTDGGAGIKYELDLNQDGIIDYIFNTLSSPGQGVFTRYVKIVPNNNNEVAMHAQDTCFDEYDSADIWYYYNLTYSLNFNDTINTFEGWQSDSSYLKYEDNIDDFYYCFGGDFADSSTFIGLKMYIDTDIIYGWVRVKNVTGYGSFTIEEYASSYQGTSAIKIRSNNEPKIYPNPSSGLYSIDGVGLNKIMVLDLTGKIILELNTGSATKQDIDLRNKPKGIYFIRVDTHEKTETIKIILE